MVKGGCVLIDRFTQSEKALRTEAKEEGQIPSLSDMAAILTIMDVDGLMMRQSAFFPLTSNLQMDLHERYKEKL